MTVTRVFKYLRRYPLLAVAQLTCAVLMTLLMLVFPWVTKVIIGDIIPSGDTPLLVTVSLLAAAAFAGTNLFNALRIILNNTFEQRIIFDIRSDLYHRIQRLPMAWFDNKRTGDVMTRVTEDVTAMERVLIDGIETGVIASLQVIGFGVWLFILNPALAGIALIPLPFLIIGAAAYTLTAAERHRHVRRAVSAMNSLLHDNIDGIQQIKSFTREPAEHDRFNTASHKVRRATLRVMRAWAVYNPSMEWFRNLGYVLVLGIGGYWAITSQHGLSVSQKGLGILASYLVSLALFYEPISRLHQLNQIIQQGRAAAERVFEIIDTTEEPHVDTGATLPDPVKGHLQFQNISFTYRPTPTKNEIQSIDSVGLRSAPAPLIPSKNSPSPSQSPAPAPAPSSPDAPLPHTLADITMEALPGQTIALVGPTGAGKSTIINLLTRFYEYDTGSISIDGQDIKSLAKQSLRARLGYVTQESFLFNDSVRYNLTIAKPDATDDELWEALNTANAARFVRSLPDQLDTSVGERGVKLSVGEKQRVSIARTLLKNPPILLLDEATASVDNETEYLIQQALERLLEHRTSLVIAHRLSTIRNADNIYVLDHGRIVESGTHDHLLTLDGLYAELSRHAFM